MPSGDTPTTTNYQVPSSKNTSRSSHTHSQRTLHSITWESLTFVLYVFNYWYKTCVFLIIIILLIRRSDHVVVAIIAHARLPPRCPRKKTDPARIREQRPGVINHCSDGYWNKRFAGNEKFIWVLFPTNTRKEREGQNETRKDDAKVTTASHIAAYSRTRVPARVRRSGGFAGEGTEKEGVPELCNASAGGKYRLHELHENVPQNLRDSDRAGRDRRQTSPSSSANVAFDHSLRQKIFPPGVSQPQHCSIVVFSSGQRETQLRSSFRVGEVVRTIKTLRYVGIMEETPCRAHSNSTLPFCFSQVPKYYCTKA